jgi:glycerol-3-phosphate dehydrogenase
MAEVLSWSDATVEEELAAYQERVAAERASQTHPDDPAADAIRLTAPDRRRLVTLPG